MTERIVEFLRKRDFVLRQELGQGACGRTVVLYDSVIDEEFVCKKYAPMHENLREALFGSFVRGHALYLVRETKGTKDFLKLRTSEADKVRCGKNTLRRLAVVAVSADEV